MTIGTTFLVEVGGTALPADVAALLTGVVVDDSQRQPDLFVLRFRDPERIVLGKAHATIGTVVKISVLTAEATAPQPLIHGEITALEAEFDAGGTFTIIRGFDPAHRLLRGRSTAGYVQMTASDIATKIARRAGLQIGEVAATSTVFPHLTQAGMTDWEMLEGLSRDIGYEVAVRAGRFSFTAPTEAGDAPAAGGPSGSDPLVVRLGRDLLRFRTGITSAQQVGEVEVRGWDVATKRALVSTAPAATTTVELPTVTAVKVADAFGASRYVGTDVPYRSQAEVEQAAKSLGSEIAGAFAQVDAVALGNPKLRAGAAITLDGLGEPFDGKYTITTSRHLFDPSTGYTTAFTVSGRHDRSMLGLASGGARSARTLAGVVIATVSDAKDPDGQGRVKVVFPWLSDDYVSDWARVVQLGAGKDRGLSILPEVDDEVLVAFEQGDMSRPYVIGGLHNGVDTMPSGPVDLLDGGSGQVNRRSFVSRLGHRIDLLDKQGATEGVSIASQDGKLSIVLDPVGTTITVHADGKVLVEGSQGVTIDAASSSLELKGGQISLTATQGVSVDGGGGAVDVKAGGQLSLTGMTAKLEGSTNTEVKGGASCSIQAAMVRIN